MTWLVTGGAGYIGSHVVRALDDAGLGAVVIDDLSSGIESFVPAHIPFVHASLLDASALASTFAENDLDGVIHCAGFKYAGESVRRPLHTYEQNVTATAMLLRAMQDADVAAIVFSSSAAVYGTPSGALVTEATPTAPESPYGETKLIGEWMVKAQALATADSPHPLAHTSLRYFNVVGSGYSDIYDASPHNLLPVVFRDLAEGRVPRINGDDYNTPDGTCVRDYIHVSDLADAHVVAARALAAGTALQPVYNLGSNAGTSVAQIMSAISDATGIPFTPTIAARRPGDPDRIVADGSAAARDLGWAMRHSIESMVASAWDAAPKH